ncbi:glutaredoxin 2 [Vibrio sp. ER1A]|uniref:glutaredoxin 2 n=1 Tax=Vibrio sp. ER1A TaxID=1517681 RepID=UPI0004DD6823|nr:glutaredoxin 2 [Vibrio sp. ER1A]KFA95371.1 glutaredoxin [Vibrio sp. ER1A]
MKLYIYDHCPFSARVRYVAGMLNLSLDIVTLDYDDDTTTKNIIGSKQVPVFVTGSGKAMAESLDIIDYLLYLADSAENSTPSQDVMRWQKDAFLPLQKIGYPRWSALPLKEFSTASAKKAWRTKKETYELNFNSLLEDTSQIASQAEVLITQANELLQLGTGSRRKLVDEAIVFSILRGFFSAPEVRWEPSVADWMVTQSQSTQVKLLNNEQYQ